jgi:autotransporter-associated beta strand protein
MKTSYAFFLRCRVVASLAACLFHSSLSAADGTWINTDVGPNNWSNATMWSGGIIADGAGFSANFTSDITAATTVTLDSNRSLTNLIFSDNGGSGSAWILNSSGGAVLTLGDGTAGSSTIQTLTNATISTVLGGANALTKTGAGTLQLGASNTYTGGTIVNAGILDLTVGGGAGAIRGALTINSGATVQVSAANGLGSTQNQRVSTTVIAGGTLDFQNTGNNSITASSITLTGGTISGMVGSKFDLRYNGVGSFTSITTTASSTTSLISVGTLGMPNNNTTFTVASGTTASGTDLLVSSTIVNNAGAGGSGSGTSSITKSGAGTMVLSGSGSTYTGATTVGAGVLAGAHANAFGDTSGIGIQGAGTLSLRGDLDTSFTRTTSGVSYPITTSATGATINVDQATMAGTGAKTMTIGSISTTSTAASYTLNFTGASSTGLTAGAVTGPASIAAGSVTLSNSNTTGITTLASYTSANTNGGETVTFSGAGSTTVAGAITPSTTALALTKSGTGALTLSSANAYTGNTTVIGGVLRLNHANALPGGVATAGGTSALVFNGSGANGGVVMLTPQTGDFTRSLAAAGVAPTASQVGWTVGSSVTGGFAAVGGDRTVNFGGAGASVTWTSTNGAFNSGLILGHDSADSTVTVVNPIALNVSGGRTVYVNNGSATVDAILSGVISTTGSRLNKEGAGTLALTATNTFGSAIGAGTNLVSINAGTLQLGNGGTTGSITATGDIDNLGTLAINRSNAITISNIIKGSGSVNQIGSGTTTLTATNTYTGTTTIADGTLALASSGRTGTGAVTVQMGSTILGTGMVQGSTFTAQSGSSVHAGADDMPGSFGTLVFTPASGSGSFDFQSGSMTTLGLNPGGSGDLLTFDGLSAGSLLFNGSLTVTAPGYVPMSVETFNLLDWVNLSSVTFASRYSPASYSGYLLGNGDDNLGFDLPDISNSGYGWDISGFALNGSISTVFIIPEPSRAALAMIGMAALLLRRRR